MSKSLFSASIAPHVHTIVSLAVGIVVVAVVAFVLARRFGGKSRPLQQLIFLLVSAVGLLAAAYVATRGLP